MDFPSMLSLLSDGFAALLAGHEPSQILLLTLVALVAGLARGFSGFGAALIFMPLASSVIDPRLAATLLWTIDAVMALPMIPPAYRQADKKAVGFMLIGAIVGAPLGTLVLATADPLVLRWSITVLVLLLLMLLVSGWRYAGRPSAPITTVVGALSGLFAGIAQIGGPPVIAYWLGGRLPAILVRANIIFFFGLSSAVSGVNYAIAGIFSWQSVALAVFAGPAYGLGLYLGSHSFGLASETIFRRLCFSLIATAAILGLPALDPWLR